MSMKAIAPLALIASLIATGAIIVRPTTLHSQAVQLVKVDVSIVTKGYRVSKLTGKTVSNDKNETIGKIDDIVIGPDNRALFAVLQVGSFLRLGGRLVAVPFESLVISEADGKIVLPGASRDELNKLAEVKYRA